MKLNTKARYAVRMMADIMKFGGDGGVVPLKDVAERQNLSKRYLSQLAMALKNAQLLKSVWGNQGGYKLGRPGTDISILEIIEAVDGPVSIIDCVFEDKICDRTHFCECRDLWSDINDAIVSKLSGFTLADLVNKSHHGAIQGKKKKE